MLPDGASWVGLAQPFEPQPSDNMHTTCKEATNASSCCRSVCTANGVQHAAVMRHGRALSSTACVPRLPTTPRRHRSAGPAAAACQDVGVRHGRRRLGVVRCPRAQAVSASAGRTCLLRCSARRNQGAQGQAHTPAAWRQCSALASWRVFFLSTRAVGACPAARGPTLRAAQLKAAYIRSLRLAVYITARKQVSTTR
jgi:hypothetical protein